MKRIFLGALVLFLVSAASAHPGKTDYQDGHTCQKNCEEWDLEYGEYHLHDKDRNPIRLGSKAGPSGERAMKGRAASMQAPLSASPDPGPAVHADPPKGVSVHTSGRGMLVTEEGMFQFRYFLLLIIAGLLVLVLHVVRTGRRTGK